MSCFTVCFQSMRGRPVFSLPLTGYYEIAAWTSVWHSSRVTTPGQSSFTDDVLWLSLLCTLPNLIIGVLEIMSFRVGCDASSYFPVTDNVSACSITVENYTENWRLYNRTFQFCGQNVATPNFTKSCYTAAFAFSKRIKFSVTSFIV